MVHQGVGDWQFSGVYWSTFDADERKRLRFQLTCTWTCSKMVNETESLQVRIEEKHRAGHWLSCPFHAKSDIWYTCWYRYITAIEISLTSGFSLIIIMVHSSRSLHLHCPPCSLTTVSLFVIFYWKLCIIHFQSLKIRSENFSLIPFSALEKFPFSRTGGYWKTNKGVIDITLWGH